MENRYIRFDWAAKKILRDKANFSILEGLITVLLGEEVHIVELLESESNQNARDDKFNRVDIKALNSKGEIILVEIQQTREFYFLERILYGVSKTITEHISLGDKYDNVRKVYSINILYFDLGMGEDYVYHGQTSFIGLNKKDELKITSKQKDVLSIKTPAEIFPEYYLIRVSAFDKIAENHLEEWMRYLKTGQIDEGTTAPGLQDAKRKLEYISMSKSERQAYDRHINDIMIENDIMYTAHIEGLAEGREEGRKEGRAEGIEQGIELGIEQGIEQGKLYTARKLKAAGIAIQVISQCTGLTLEQIAEL